MTRPTLLRRAAAAAIGVDRRPSHARSLPLAQDLPLRRRAAAAIIGVRAYRLPTATRAGAPAQLTSVRSASEGSRPEQLPLVTLAPVPLGVPEGESVRERPLRRGRGMAKGRPRRGLVLTTAAVTIAIAFGSYVYHEEIFVNGPPAGGPPTATSTTTETPTTGPATPTGKAPPTGAMPKKYLGTWKGTIENDLGRHTRWMVIRQAQVGDTVLTLTAVGPTKDGGGYRCVFEARLDSVKADTVKTSSSTVTSAKPKSSCAPGKPSTLTLVGENGLRRATSDDRGTTYNRSQ